jgi:hypothetical protein
MAVFRTTLTALSPCFSKHLGAVILFCRGVIPFLKPPDSPP